MSEFHTGCGAYCDSDDPCMCCQLGTEVDSLRAGARVAQAAAGKRIAELTALLKAADDVVTSQDRRIDAALAFCEQQAKNRSPYSDDREEYDLAYIDGWNDALDRVEQLLRGES